MPAIPPPTTSTTLRQRQVIDLQWDKAAAPFRPPSKPCHGFERGRVLINLCTQESMLRMLDISRRYDSIPLAGSTPRKWIHGLRRAGGNHHAVDLLRLMASSISPLRVAGTGKTFDGRRRRHPECPGKLHDLLTSTTPRCAAAVADKNADARCIDVDDRLNFRRLGPVALASA